MKLFCFPYAGGSATAYQKWSKYVAGTVTLCPVELNGRGKLSRFSLYTDFAEMVEEVLARIEPQLSEGRYAFYGHSMGARLAFELAHRIQDKGLGKPEAILMSGCGAPSFKPNRQPPHLMPDDVFKREIADLGGMPAEVLDNEQLFHYYAPVIRADLRNLEYLIPRPVYEPLDTDFVLLHGDRDKIPLAAVEAWRSYTLRPCRIEVFSGGHFFINDHAEQLTGVMQRILSGTVLDAR